MSDHCKYNDEEIARDLLKFRAAALRVLAPPHVETFRIRLVAKVARHGDVDEFAV